MAQPELQSGGSKHLLLLTVDTYQKIQPLVTLVISHPAPARTKVEVPADGDAPHGQRGHPGRTERDPEGTEEEEDMKVHHLQNVMIIQSNPVRLRWTVVLVSHKGPRDNLTIQHPQQQTGPEPVQPDAALVQQNH